MKKADRIDLFRHDLLEGLEGIDDNAPFEEEATKLVISLVAIYKLEKLLPDYKIVEKTESGKTARHLERNDVPLKKEEYALILS